MTMKSCKNCDGYVSFYHRLNSWKHDYNYIYNKNGRFNVCKNPEPAEQKEVKR